jgi:phosphate starvation-inducible PhoH-like protein
MGFGSRVVVTGDVTQIDLPEGRASGLLHAERVLGGVPEISFCRLTDSDVVRHSLVKKIIGAYERYEKRAGKSEKQKPEKSRTGWDKPWQEKSGQQKPWQEKSRPEKPWQDKSKHDKYRPDKPRPERKL